MRDAYSYDPGTNKWTPIPSLPVDLFGAGYTASSGRFLVQDGITNNALAVTNQGWSYDPGSNQWTALSPALSAEFRGGSSLGFYKVGGNPGAGPETSLTSAEVLAGLDTP